MTATKHLFLWLAVGILMSVSYIAQPVFEPDYGNPDPKFNNMIYEQIKTDEGLEGGYKPHGEETLICPKHDR